jgi:hypothetical protein
MELILAEQLLLLLLDDESGADQAGWSRDPGLAGALLLDLAAAGAIRESDGKLVTADSPPQHPLLAAAHAAIAAADKPRDAKHWVGRLPTALKPLAGRLAAGLVERGVLREEKRKLLGLFNQTRYPEVDGTYEDDVRARLGSVLLAEREPARDEAMLVALLLPYDKVKTLVPKDQRKPANERAKAIADRGVAGKAVEDALAAIQVAVIAAATVATTSAAVSGSN